jgi:hypothetical protein
MYVPQYADELRCTVLLMMYTDSTRLHVTLTGRGRTYYTALSLRSGQSTANS